jgi:hypothetical protein
MGKTLSRSEHKMECRKCNRELTEYEEHGFWNKNPYVKLCINCIIEKTLPENRASMKIKIAKSLEIWETRHWEY